MLDNSKLPLLINESEDMLYSSVISYSVRHGTTRVGTAPLREGDHAIVLEAPDLAPVHAFLESDGEYVYITPASQILALDQPLVWPPPPASAAAADASGTAPEVDAAEALLVDQAAVDADDLLTEVPPPADAPTGIDADAPTPAAAADTTPAAESTPGASAVPADADAPPPAAAADTTPAAGSTPEASAAPAEAASPPPAALGTADVLLAAWRELLERSAAAGTPPLAQVYINDMPVERRTRLRHRQQIRIGAHYRFRFQHPIEAEKLYQQRQTVMEGSPMPWPLGGSSTPDDAAAWSPARPARALTPSQPATPVAEATRVLSTATTSAGSGAPSTVDDDDGEDDQRPSTPAPAAGGKGSGTTDGPPNGDTSQQSLEQLARVTLLVCRVGIGRTVLVSR